MQFADNAGPDQSAHKRRLICAFVFPLTDSVDTVVYIDEQNMPRLDCTDAHAGLDLRCLQIFTRAFFVRCASYQLSLNGRQHAFGHVCPAKNLICVLAQSDQNLHFVHFRRSRMQSSFIQTAKTDQTTNEHADMSLCWAYMSEVMCSHVPSDYDMLVVETAKPKGTLEMFKLMRTFVFLLYNLLAFNHYQNA